MQLEPDNEDITINGIITETIFYREDNGYRIVKIDPDNNGRGFIACGIFGEVDIGEYLSLKGIWQQHPRFGLQFKMNIFSVKMPNTIEGLRSYLGSGMIPGVGLAFATRIIQQFGTDTLDVLNNHPEKLNLVKGLGAKKCKEIEAFWKKKENSRKLMLFLGEHGISFSIGLKIQKAWGDEALNRLQNEPYSLIESVKGVGFISADRLALKIGVKFDSPERIQNCHIYCLQKSINDGHCYLEKNILIETVFNFVQTDQQIIINTLNQLIVENRVVNIDDKIQLPHIHDIEKSIADEVIRRCDSGPFIPFQMTDLISSKEKVANEVSDEQLESMSKVLSAGFSILTGGPGVGKTTIVKILVDYFENKGFPPVLSAPTGRAAQRLEATTGRKSSTLHRLLKYRPDNEQSFAHNEEYPLPDVIYIIDEFSMVDIFLFEAFLKALPQRCQIILVGDSDQLPSVGAGRILNDLIASKKISVSRLTQVFRQKKGSALVKNSHRIIKREMPLEMNQSKQLEDFYFIESKDDKHTLGIIEKMIKDRIPSRFGENAIADTQVLSPMKKGPLGTFALNQHLQNWINPHGEKINYKEETFRVGDKVIQLNNNYDIDLYNGDLGVIIANADDGIKVQFGEKIVIYPIDTLSDISLAYACTVHKSQGSEYPIVIMPIYSGHRLMLSIELIYTAMTRARLMCVWIGKKEFLQNLLENPVKCERKTMLKEYLESH